VKTEKLLSDIVQFLTQTHYYHTVPATPTNQHLKGCCHLLTNDNRFDLLLYSRFLIIVFSVVTSCENIQCASLFFCQNAYLLYKRKTKQRTYRI